jgi:hypothetical protein
LCAANNVEDGYGSEETADYQQRLDSLQSQFDGKKITIDELSHGLTLLMATKI